MSVDLHGRRVRSRSERSKDQRDQLKPGSDDALALCRTFSVSQLPDQDCCKCIASWHSINQALTVFRFFFFLLFFELSTLTSCTTSGS
jgi:hypothetical protein